METLAIIPARGGSKRIPKKNIADLAGYPLIAYSIASAKVSSQVDRIIASYEILILECQLPPIQQGKCQP